MLEEYLSLEALRFGDTFSYSITMDDNVDPYTLDVPPMIIQPFVENAVKHGLLHKEGEQCIQLHVKFNESRNIIEVALFDNGVGRKASAEINKHRQSHESFSTSATQKRFEILNQSTVELFSFDYEDMEDGNGLSLGTRRSYCFTN
jgi:two-component system LytT family sensor kinase